MMMKKRPDKESNTTHYCVIVAGGQDFTDKDYLTKSLDLLLQSFNDVEIISGHARGADQLAEDYASQKGLPLKIFPAEWNRYGKAAGPIRNGAMLKYAQEGIPVVAAFWNGKSRGTANMLKLAEAAGAEYHIYMYDVQEKKEPMSDD